MCNIIPLTCEASQVALVLKNLLPMWEAWVLSLGREYPLEEGMTTHSTILPGESPWTEEPDGLQSMGSQNRTRLKLLSMHSRSLHIMQELTTVYSHCLFLFFHLKIRIYVAVSDLSCGVRALRVSCEVVCFAAMLLLRGLGLSGCGAQASG